MKKLLLTALLGFLGLLVFAQTTMEVKGHVIDSVTNKPLDFVTVALTDAASKQPVKSTLTKDDGSFELKNLALKNYQLTLVYIGYSSKIINVKPGSVNLGRIVLSPTASQLKEVAVTAVKPLMKQEVDRLSYDVQADPEAKSNTALDMLRKVPLLSVDASDNIKLRGSGNYKILLNGKESALMANSPSDVLKAMPGTNILKIEVITSPPAKYDAEGLAGIINIITVKNADQGYNGSINANLNSVNGPRINANVTVKQGKFGITAFAGTGNRPQRFTNYNNSTTFITTPSGIIQTGNRGTGNNNKYGNAELSYELDTLNLLTASINQYSGHNVAGNNQYNVILNGSNVITDTYNVVNAGDVNTTNTDLALNYQLGFKQHKDQLLTASYKYSNNNNRQFNDIMTDQAGRPNYRQYNVAGGKEHTAQLDYIQPRKIWTIEAGGKMILRNNFSNFNNDVQNTSGLYITDPLQTNNFAYHQDVYAAYNSYTVKLTKWVFKAGARFERTDIDANFAAGQSFERTYSNLVPSVSAQRSFKNSSLTFGFTQRIERPNIYQLNPFVNTSNPLYIEVGNPNLRPAINNNFELGYGNFAKGSLNISASYSFANNAVQDIQTVNGNVTTETYANVGHNRQAGIDVNTNYPITSKFTININAELLRVWLSGVVGSKFYSNAGQQGHIFSYYSYKFNNGFRAGFNVGYDSRYILLQGVDNYWLGYGTSLSKDILKGKGTISFMTNSPFKKYYRLDFITRTDDFYSYNTRDVFYRTLNLSFNYKFGKLNSDIKKNQRGINNDDSSSGGRN